jgi:hypothetical protein
MEVDIIGALGRYWGEAELRPLTAAFHIAGEVADPGSLRRDKARYALFVNLGDDGSMARFAVQTPVVVTPEPGFEER